ncbi:MAG: GAF and ANTAR domain-containing protein [Nocardioidaceae bacterium]
MFVQVADTLVDEFDLIDFLHMVTSQTSELVNARDAGLLLADPQGRLQLMAASDERTQMLELFQVQMVEGPCQDCFREGEPVVNADLREAGQRWPKFAPRAVAAGFRSVHAFPLRLRKDVIGALNLFGTDAGEMEAGDVRIVQALADVATIGLLQQRAVRRGAALSEQLQIALNSRVVLEQAKGALAQMHGTSPDQAFQRLRAYCRSHNLRLGEVAQAVVSDPKRFPDLTTRKG